MCVCIYNGGLGTDFFFCACHCPLNKPFFLSRSSTLGLSGQIMSLSPMTDRGARSLGGMMNEKLLKVPPRTHEREEPISIHIVIAASF